MRRGSAPDACGSSAAAKVTARTTSDVELVKNRETRKPLVPFNSSGEAFTPVARVYKAALERGLYLMTHWNVIMVCPPLTITADELAEGLDVLDDALAVADEFVAS